MANDFSAIIPIAVSAAQVVSQELIGHIPSVTLYPSAERIAMGQNIVMPFVGVASPSDWSPSMTLPSDNGETPTTQTLTVNYAKTHPILWTGNDELAAGTVGASMLQNQFTQVFRAINNQIEASIVAALKPASSRARGTAGTVPFGNTKIDAPAWMAGVLDANGAPGDRSLVLSTAAAEGARQHQNLTQVANAGTTDILNNGVIGNLAGMRVRTSGQNSSVTAGTGASYQINHSGGYVAGDTSLVLDTGTGTILAGNVITIGNYSYVVKTALTSNVVVINEPGLMETVADNAAVTVAATYTPSFAYSRDAVILATRLPALNRLGDAAIFREVVTSPSSGISYEIAAYAGDHAITFAVYALWGVKAVQPRHIATLLG